MKHLTAEPELDLLEEPYRDIVRRALAKDPAVRLKGVDELLELLPKSAGDVPAYIGHSQPKPIDLETGSDTLPAATEHPHYEEEPIYAALRDGWDYCERSWHASNLHPLIQMVVVVGMVIGLVSFVPVWLPTLFSAFFIYAVYYAIRGLLLQSMDSRSEPKKDAKPKQAALVANRSANPPRHMSPQRKRRLKKSWRIMALKEEGQKPLRLKLIETIRSMLLAAMMVLVVALVSCAPFNQGGVYDNSWWAMLLWLSSLGTLGSWAILIPTRFAEGKIEDEIPMRTILLLLGALVGTASYYLDSHLVFDANQIDSWSTEHNKAFTTSFLGSNSPTVLGSMAYFAFLFVILRWWKKAEFTRSKRMSITAVVTAVFWAYCLHYFWWFPQPAGMMVAGTIALSTQLAAHWCPPSRRKELTEQAIAMASTTPHVNA